MLVSHRPILPPGTQAEVLGGTWVRLEPCEGEVMVVLGESCGVGGLGQLRTMLEVSGGAEELQGRGVWGRVRSERGPVAGEPWCTMSPFSWLQATPHPSNLSQPQHSSPSQHAGLCTLPRMFPAAGTPSALSTDPQSQLTFSAVEVAVLVPAGNVWQWLRHPK